MDDQHTGFDPHDIEAIKEIIEKVKGKYLKFGGDVQFVDIVDSKVRVRPTGYCHR